MKHKKRIWAIMSIAIIIVAIISTIIVITNRAQTTVGSTGNVVLQQEQTTQQETVVNEPIVIGATLALSGSYAYFGEQELLGLQMAVDEINAQGGIKGRELKLVVEDNKGDAKEAVLNTNKLLEIDHVQIMFSAFTGITGAVAPRVAESKFGNAQVILFYESTVADFAKNNEYTFRDYFDAYEHGSIIADQIAQKGFTRVKILSEKSDQCTQFQKGVTEHLTSNRKVLQIEEYLVQDTDLKSAIIKLQLQPIDALVVCGWRHETIIMKTMKELGLMNITSFHIIAPYLPVANTPEMRALFEEGNVISTWYGLSEKAINPREQTFIEKFVAIHHVKPSPDATYTYDDIMIIAQAIEKCEDTTDNDCIRDNIAKTSYDGIKDHITFDSNRSTTRPVMLIQFKNHTIQEIKR